MKKHITIIFLFHFFFLFSQKGIVEYGYVESLGLGNAQGLDYNSMLIFDQNYSNYVTGKESLEKIEKITETKKVEVDGEVIAVFNGLGVTKEGNQVFYSKKDRFMLSTLYFKEVFYINDSIVNINWKITKETKKIGKFNCKKATTNFRGRKYIAWYTIDIPVSYGPWKLQGLPGLILEAYDTDKFVYWYFKNIDYPTNSKDEVVKIDNLNFVNFLNYKEFKNIQKIKLKKIEERNAMIMKDMPNVEITSPKLNELFIECE
jgi:GLPGLI family protein